jgi:hypothetical protein
MDDKAELERFAQLLMTLVRDRAISACDRLARGATVGPSGQRWHAVMAERSTQDALLDLIPEVVDATLFEFLDAIDNGALPLCWEAEDGSCESLKELGRWEMAGWLAGGDWPKRYSAERFHDYFADLRLDLGDGDA